MDSTSISKEWTNPKLENTKLRGYVKVYES